MFVQDTMASEQGCVELGLSCADICQALDRGTDEKKSEEQKLDKKPDEKKVDEKGLDEEKPAEKKVNEKNPVEKKVDEKKPAEKKVDEKKPAKKPNEKKPDEKKSDEPSQAVRTTTNKPTKWVIPVVRSMVSSLTTRLIAELLRNPREKLPNRVRAPPHLPEPPVSQRASRKRLLLGGRNSTGFCMSSMYVQSHLTGSC
jgi:flagellar biosynthesis GTPase FlhF